MDILQRFLFVGNVAYARYQTRAGMSSYNSLRHRIPALDYDESDPYEREAVNVFYNDIEDTGLGARMQAITDELDALYTQLNRQINSPEEGEDIINDDHAFEQVVTQFEEIMERWGPVADECQAVFARLSDLVIRKERGE